jgi:recombination associated protein RdgC
MFKNALLYRIAHWDPSAIHTLEDKLAAARFTECGATQPESAGWVEPRGERHGALAETVAGQWILSLCIETKAVPASAVKARLTQELDKIEKDTGRRPKGRRAKEMKEAIVQELLPRAFPKRSTMPVWIAPRTGWVLVGAGSAKKADAVTAQLVELLGGGLTLRLVDTELSPARAMAQWLQDKQAPAGFSIDRDCELKQPDSEKASVRYARHTLDIDEVGEHIRQGKQPTQLALTWADRVSFVLHESMSLKKIKLLDGVLETLGDEERNFDADVALFTGELSRLIPDLLDALGGEQMRDAQLPRHEEAVAA